MGRNRLYYYHELAAWQRDNHFIRSAYIKETSSYTKCLNSLTYLHNESVNIYSHLLPAVLIVLKLTCFQTVDKYQMDPRWVKLSILQFEVGAYICLSSSALFHLFKCHSQRVCNFGNRCDYFGIVVMITSSLISVMMFAFDEIPRWRNFFVVIFIMLGVSCSVMTLARKFSTPAYRPFRSLIFILFGLSGSIPVIFASIHFGLRDSLNRFGAKWIILEGLFYITGAMLYAARFPEHLYHTEESHSRRVRGKFDLFGHSHQIFHFMVVVAALCHSQALSFCYMQWKLRRAE